MPNHPTPIAALLVWFDQVEDELLLREQTICATLVQALEMGARLALDEAFLLGQVLAADGKVLATFCKHGFHHPPAHPVAGAV